MNTRIDSENRPDHEVVVIGAGPGGIAAGVLLQRAGIDDFAIFERADGVGGSWRDNDYPGIGVDVPCLGYQYSFARKHDWSRLFPKGHEIHEYLVDVVARFGLAPHLRFGAEIVRETWDDQRHHWRLELGGGEVVTARFVVSAVGAFIRPKEDVGIPGVEDFEGKVQRPTQWDHGAVLAGKRVAVIGTGASSVQISPAIAPQVDRLSVFQRTPVWCIPKADLRFAPWFQRLLRLPGAGALIHGLGLVAVELGTRVLVSTPLPLAKLMMRGLDAFAKRAYGAYIRSVVKDPETAAALTPEYGPLGKRPTISNAYLQAFNRDNTELVTTPIETLTKKGLRTRDGIEHEFDMIVLATGYELFSDPETYRPGTIVGRDGFDLGAFYAEHGLQAYESVSVPQLPNRWMLVGPYSWTGTGWHFMVETSAGHAIRVIREARRRGATRAEIRQPVHDAYHARLRRRGRAVHHYFAVQNRGLRTYYVNSQGDTPYLRPFTAFETLWRSRTFPLDDYAYASQASGPRDP
ncbi:MAG: NAD(P)/FAD-dependent oxidoreductase [Proteobacteria bacterium]|nr:NAD(P)/FAD-dependent oxidoreductase [Pseudomonadota bacterium]